MAEEIRQISDFKRVVLRGWGKLILRKGDAEALVVEADEEFLSKVSSVVENETLELQVGRKFLDALHSKLDSGSKVFFIDQLPYDGFKRRIDNKGNTLEMRTLPDGRKFEIVKNFPSEDEVKEVLSGIADDIQFTVHLNEKSWSVVYRVR